MTQFHILVNSAGDKEPRKGFSLLETIISIAVGIIFTLLLFLGLSGFKSRTEFSGVSSELVSILREAQSRALAQASSTTWGVHFENAAARPFAVLFYGTYSTSTRVTYFAFPPNVTYATSSLASGASTELTFSPVTGFPSGTLSVVIQTLSGTTSTTISVNSRGEVSY